MLSLLLLAPLALASPTPGSTITLPLGRAQNANRYPDARSHLAARAEPLTDLLFDAMYAGNGTIRKSTFQFLFDTGSSDVLVPDPICAPFMCSGEKYDRKGKDLNRTLELSYGSGSVAGYLFEDSVTVDGFTAKNQKLVSMGEDSLLQESGANGLIGMAFPAAAKTNGTTFFGNLMKQGVVKKPEFGIYYGRDADGTGKDSEITLGGRNPKKFTGPTYEYPVVEEYWWTLKLDEVKVNGACAGDATRGYGMIDSGTQNIVAPKAAVAAIFSKIPGAELAGNKSVGGFLDSTTAYRYPCKTPAKYMPKLVFGGREFAIDPKDLNGGDDEKDGYCMSNIFGKDVERPIGKVWIVGDVFLKSWYTIFNHKGANGKPSVLFAKSVQKK